MVTESQTRVIQLPTYLISNESVFCVYMGFPGLEYVLPSYEIKMFTHIRNLLNEKSMPSLDHNLNKVALSDAF